MFAIAMSDSIWDGDNDSFIDTISNSSEFSFGEEVDFEHNEWLREMLIAIDRVVLLDKDPPPKFPSHVLSECLEWKTAFRTKFTESERGAIFLRNSIHCNSTSPGSSRQSSSNSLRERSIFPNSEFSGSNIDSRSSSSREFFDQTVTRRSAPLESMKPSRNSKSLLLDPLDTGTIRQTGQNVLIELHRRPPLKLPPIQSGDKTQQSSSRFWSKLPSVKKGFPMPPLFFSLEDLLPIKSPVDLDEEVSSIINSNRKT
ncbi:uncharacterized protein LOC141853257 [Brevipalpus obovatus]|uniref:uncharacterized protein LOC141853257 n=1 Tax=Brevipalpus obovatus TaxID=246614 RepID=UPI003D9FB136